MLEHAGELEVETGVEEVATISSLKGICPRGNNKMVIIIFHVYDKCLFLMLELY
jgi:hypothetical protein